MTPATAFVEISSSFHVDGQYSKVITVGEVITIAADQDVLILSRVVESQNLTLGFMWEHNEIRGQVRHFRYTRVCCW